MTTTGGGEEGKHSERECRSYGWLILAGLLILLRRATPNLEFTVLPMKPKRSRADLKLQMLGWGVVVVSGILIAVGGCWLIGLRPSTAGFDRTHHLPFRLLLAVLFLALVPWAIKVSGALADRFWTTWWDPSLVRPDGPIGWKEVLELTVGDEHGDALTRSELFRRCHFWRHAPVHALGVAATLLASMIVVDRLLKWRMPAFFWANPQTLGNLAGAVASASGNLTAYLALLAAAISIIFTYNQLRAKVRADNRQVWINRARQLIAQIIADADAKPCAARPSAKAISRRLELELMMNPKEKDHRVLTFLVQRLVDVPDLDQIEAGQHLRRVVKDELSRSSRHDRQQNLLAVLDEKDRGKLTSYVVRLSHVLLKREWERVKHTR